MFKSLFIKELLLLGSAKNRILSFLILLLSMLFIYHFSLERNSNLNVESLIGIKWSSIFILSYILIGQMTEDETESEAYKITRLSIPIGLEFIVKSILVFFGLVLIFIFQSLVIGILFESGSKILSNFFLVLFLSVPGLLSLSFLGVLLSDLSFETKKKELLLPVLLIPLSIPVLLMSISAEMKFFGNGELHLSSLILLFSFSILYLSLGLIFKEYILD
jgi:heme exporter protein B